MALPLAVLVPIAGGVLAPLLARWSARLALAVAVLASAASGVVLALAGRTGPTYLGGWGPVIGIEYVADRFGFTVALAASVVGTLALLATLSGMQELGRRELGGYACLSLLLIAAVIAAALTADLLHLFVWFEVAGLASYALTGFFLERPHALEATFKIIVLTSIAGFFIFIGTALLYQAHAVVNLPQLQRAFAARPSVLDAAAVALLLAGFATKAGLIPFCGWLPDAHTAAPGPISALFSGMMVNLGVVGIVRVTAAAPHLPTSGVLTVVGCASALFGAFAAAVQEDLKRLLAYDTISQIGIVTAGLAVSRDAALYHLVSHALFKALLFLVAGAIVHTTGATQLAELAGTGRRSPALALLFIVGVAAIAGVPPLNGYVSLGLLHAALRSSHQTVALTAVLVAQVATVAALTRAVRAMWARTQDPQFARDERLRPGMAVALGTLALACVATGVATPVAFDWADPVELLFTGVTVAAGIALASMVSPRAPRLRDRLAVVATGSVNDYALYLSAGLIVVFAAVRLG
ncbi:complex I subunit 5 family protein [Dactylosporangium sp. CA-139066]|uniref:complex I subunit 5 family protein n=1 Tax=Dactylosporangium sp. CA-139066 TaxID=3239930 RepID=UPI003D8F5EAE